LTIKISQQLKKKIKKKIKIKIIILVKMEIKMMKILILNQNLFLTKMTIYLHNQKKKKNLIIQFVPKLKNLYKEMIGVVKNMDL